MDTDYVDYIKDYNESDTSSLKMLLKKKFKIQNKNYN